MVATVVTAVVAGTLAAVFARWTVSDGLRTTVLADIDRTTGLRLVSAGPMRVRVLPRPTIEIEQVSVRGLDGAVALDAASMHGRLAILPLLDGRLRIDAASLESPTAVLDLDRLQPILDTLLSPAGSVQLLRLLHTAGLKLRAGVIRLRSADPRRDTLLTDVTTTFEWPGDDAEATLSGTATWRGVSGDFALDIDNPGELRRGGQALASVRLKSAALDLDAQGSLFGSGPLHATGKLSAATSDLPGFLRMIDTPAPQVGRLHQARLSGTASVAGDTLSLDDTALTLDDMLFDGAVAVRRRGDRTSLAGTLATDRLDLDGFLAALPPFVGDDGRWSAAALGTRAIAYDDIDLRVSATTAKFGAFRIEDGSLSLQSGDGRMELSLGEARAYDGLLKGRVVATLDGGLTDVRADATLSRLDLAQFMKDVPGKYRAAGIVSGHAAVQSRGSSAASLAGALEGRGEVAVRSGEIGGGLVTMLVHQAPAASLVAVPLGVGSTPFDAAAIDVRIADGVATLGDSWIAWPEARATLSGKAHVADQTLALRAAVSPAGSTDLSGVFDVGGPWRDLRLKPARPAL